MVRSKTPFWHAFGIAFFCNTLTTFVVDVAYEGPLNAFLALVGGIGIFGLLGWKFPRCAAALLLLISVVAAVSEVMIGIRRDAWRFLLLPVDVTAALFAAYAFKLAADYVAAGRHTD